MIVLALYLNLAVIRQHRPAFLYGRILPGRHASVEIDQVCAVEAHADCWCSEVADSKSVKA